MRSFSLKTLLVTALLWSSLSASAQFETVYLGVNGLTCSQCSRTVEMSIRTLDFVDDVQMNLQHTEGKIVLKKNRKTDIEKIAQAVADAGFSVRYLRADFNTDKMTTGVEGTCFNYNGDQYLFAQNHRSPVKGVVQLTFLGKKYQPRNEFKKSSSTDDSKCGKVGGKVYHVAVVPL